MGRNGRCLNSDGVWSKWEWANCGRGRREDKWVLYCAGCGHCRSIASGRSVVDTRRVVPVRAMRTYWGSWSTDPVLLNLTTTGRWTHFQLLASHVNQESLMSAVQSRRLGLSSLLRCLEFHLKMEVIPLAKRCGAQKNKRKDNLELWTVHFVLLLD
jgi:hypothetical protein